MLGLIIWYELDRLLKQTREEGIVFREALFLLIMYYGESNPGSTSELIGVEGLFLKAKIQGLRK